ncbi:ABC transporter [Aurantiacibacter aquimixticola]|uniref:ABC transporter n=1 Tax=Aurantiacibacter aquimixticola TaxID=1958945 RepID=A0A419RTB1_9SPHN|nr:ABC transporter [Aurantiacibacter aquimixticola]RJY09009.1 ABC transporter [Aurantiacibacter aquimixticola]
MAVPVAAQVDVSAGFEDEADTRPTLALMGTIPIYWGEADGFADLLSGESEAHWARRVLQESWRVAPLDYLSADALSPHRFLMLAQPRGFSGEENVALDDWVRAGGRLLLFADPMMTGHSHFGIGDRRRPQDVALLSPILGRWGLALQFDDTRHEGMTTGEFAGQVVPVNLPGQFVSVDGGMAQCTIAAEGLVAQCRIGDGAALIVADAAMLDVEGPHADATAALDLLLAQATGISREIESVSVDD